MNKKIKCAGCGRDIKRLLSFSALTLSWESFYDPDEPNSKTHGIFGHELPGVFCKNCRDNLFNKFVQSGGWK